MDLGKEARVSSTQIDFAERDINPDASKETDYHAYKLYISNNGKDWKQIVDKSKNTIAAPYEYVKPSVLVEVSFIKIENVHTPKEGKFALLDLRVFSFGYSEKPGLVKRLSVQRDQEDERYALLTWDKVSGTDGCLVRSGYQPDFLNQYIQVKDCETTDLLLHILTKGVKYHYRVDTYNDSGITEGVVISE